MVRTSCVVVVVVAAIVPRTIAETLYLHDSTDKFSELSTTNCRSNVIVKFTDGVGINAFDDNVYKDEWLRKISLGLTNCHLQANERGVEVYVSPIDMDDTHFGIYTQFVIHAESIVNTLIKSQWQTKVMNMMNDLETVSAAAANDIHLLQLEQVKMRKYSDVVIKNIKTTRHELSKLSKLQRSKIQELDDFVRISALTTKDTIRNISLGVITIGDKQSNLMRITDDISAQTLMNYEAADGIRSNIEAFVDDWGVILDHLDKVSRENWFEKAKEGVVYFIWFYTVRIATNCTRLFRFQMITLFTSVFFAAYGKIEDDGMMKTVLFTISMVITAMSLIRDFSSNTGTGIKQQIE